MQDAHLVGVVEARTGRQHDCAGIRLAEALAAEPAADRPAGQPLHHQQADAFVLDEVVDRDDVRMVEGGQELGLRAKSRLHLGIASEGRGELLDRHLTAELAVAAGDHDAPGAAAELLSHLVGRERLDDDVPILAHQRDPSAAQLRPSAGSPAARVSAACRERLIGRDVLHQQALHAGGRRLARFGER